MCVDSASFLKVLRFLSLFFFSCYRSKLDLSGYGKRTAFWMRLRQMSQEKLRDILTELFIVFCFSICHLFPIFAKLGRIYRLAASSLKMIKLMKIIAVHVLTTPLFISCNFCFRLNHVQNSANIRPIGEEVLAGNGDSVDVRIFDLCRLFSHSTMESQKGSPCSGGCLETETIETDEVQLWLFI